MDSLLINGDFGTGKLAPWTSASGEETWEIKPEGAGYYIQLTKAAELTQNTPEGSYKPTVLTFEARAGQTLKPGDFVMFSYSALVTTAEGAEGYGDLGAATETWQTMTLNIDRKPSPATTVTVQVHTASDPEKLNGQPGQVHFRNFRLV
ncbi:hypothetical protein [Pseudomonas sp. NFR16]|uniref:hypothetical protein n=1 Tax=Pseudomonas sp. NFR16 TaxID=1566248 RepID=UPI0008B3F294|nr:hypothetical protein [Pseudomonas sp. NFR16]SEJ86228.1 hypothetical protein SAMN03159495_4892 [Pseudomonas sp. NFR16]